MPRLKSLKLGWAMRGDIRHADTGFYPDRVVNEIAEEFGIKSADEILSLKQRLETAGTTYLAWRHNSAGPSGRDLRAYFAAVIERSRDLIELIDKADDRAWSFIGRTENRLQFDTLREVDTRLVDIGVFRWRNESDPENTIAVYSGLRDTIPHLRYIQLMATECLAQVDLGKPGRTRDEALYWWVYEVARFWETDMGEQFTVTYHRSEPISRAGRFLQACLMPMDQEAVGQLVGQMRQILKDRKKRLEKN